MAKVKQEDSLTLVSRFAQQIAGSKKLIYIGIDPGATGAIAFLCGTAHTVVDIPIIKVPVKRTKKLSPKQALETGRKTRVQEGLTSEADYAGICSIFRLMKPFKDRIGAVALEKVPKTVGGGWGVTISDVMAYASYKMWPLYLHARGYVVDEVTPAVWKAHYHLSRKSSKRFGLGKNQKLSKGKATAEGAEASRHKAMMMFPRASLQRKGDHNRAEALLIAEFVRELHGSKR